MNSSPGAVVSQAPDTAHCVTWRKVTAELLVLFAEILTYCTSYNTSHFV